MKLIFCLSCHWLMKLMEGPRRTCLCGRSWGRYLADGDHAEYGGRSVPVAIGNASFAAAVKAVEAGGPRRNKSIPFKAWVVPPTSEKFIKVKERQWRKAC